MLPLARKRVETDGPRIDPLHASARYQALHHFIAKAQWSDAEVLRRVCLWVVPHTSLINLLEVKNFIKRQVSAFL